MQQKGVPVDWDERYTEPGFAYGTEPNDFLVSVVSAIPPGRILSLAEGEGRNAVYLASRGFDVTGVDSSSVGLAKARSLAAERGVSISTLQADLGSFLIGQEAWDGIIACYCHLPSSLRAPLHRSVVQGLRPGGAFVLEAFSREQPAYGTGGPQSPDLLMALDEVKAELAGLEFLQAVTVEREVREGRHHTGLASVIQVFGRKI